MSLVRTSVLRSYSSSFYKYSIPRLLKPYSLHNTPPFRCCSNIRLQAQAASDTSIESTLPSESVTFTSDNENSESMKIFLTDLPVEVTVTILPTFKTSLSSHNLLPNIVTAPCQPSNPSQSVKSTLNELPSQMLQTIEELLPISHKPLFLESAKNCFTSSIQQHQDYDLPPPGAKYPYWDPDSQSCDAELLLMERYFLDWWLWMAKFDENYTFDLTPTEDMLSDVMCIPGLNEESIYLKSEKRYLFEEKFTNVSEVIRSYYVIGPSFIPVQGTSILVGLNWPFRVFARI